MDDTNTSLSGRAMMNSKPLVRVLQSPEVPTLRELLAVFGAAFEDRETYLDKQPSQEYLTALLSNPNFVAVTAAVDDKLVGGLAGYILPKFEQARSEFYIYDLAVDQRYRRRGIATALITCLQRFAATKGVNVIFVQADYGDDAGVALYTKLGTREDVMHFDIKPRGAV